MEWEKIFANYISDKGLISIIYKECIKLNSNKIIQLKWAKDLNRLFFQRRHTNGQQIYENVLNITNHQGNANKITLGYYLTPGSMTIIKKTRGNKCLWGCGEKETLKHCWWECNFGIVIMKNSTKVAQKIWLYIQKKWTQYLKEVSAVQCSL